MVAAEVVGVQEERDAPAGLVADAGALGVVRGLCKQEAGLGARRRDHDPALFAAEPSVFAQFEPQHADIERDRGVVVVDHQREQADAAGAHDAIDQPPSARRWASSSSRMPFSARPSRASSSSRRKAWPSAVPCSSMKPPPSFITTFMSVSQSLSSA